MAITGLETIADKLKTRTLLIVEDNQGIRLWMRTLVLEAFPDLCIVESTGGEEAVALTLLHLPEVVLMDIGLPQMNGLEATWWIKAIVPQAHVVIVTNHGVLEYEEKATRAEPYAYVVKKDISSKLIPVLRQIVTPGVRLNGDKKI
jgi:DNA-binding NarL/FixJ family response regulator